MKLSADSARIKESIHYSEKVLEKYFVYNLLLIIYKIGNIQIKPFPHFPGINYLRYQGSALKKSQIHIKCYKDHTPTELGKDDLLFHLLIFFSLIIC